MAEIITWIASGSIVSLIFFSLLVFAALTLLIVYLISFFQGREISFWPPKIGKKDSVKKIEAQKRNINKFTKSEVEDKSLQLISSESIFLDAEFNHCKSIYISGMNLRRTITNYYGFFEQKLTSGANLKFILVDPNSDAISFIAERNYVYKDKSKLIATIESTLSSLSQLSSIESKRGTIEVKLLSHVPSFGLILFDPELSSGKIKIDIYPYRVPPDNYPSFYVKKNVEKLWFKFFYEQFYLLWDAAHPYDLKKINTSQNIEMQ